MKFDKKPFVQSGRDLTAPSAWKSQTGVLGSVIFSDSRKIIDVELDDLIPEALAVALTDMRHDRRRPFSFIAVSGYYGALWEISFLVRIPQKASIEQLGSSLNGYFQQFGERASLREVAAPSNIAEVMCSTAQLAAGWYVKTDHPNVRDRWAQILRTEGGSTNDQ